MDRLCYGITQICSDGAMKGSGLSTSNGRRWPPLPYLTLSTGGGHLLTSCLSKKLKRELPKKTRFPTFSILAVLLSKNADQSRYEGGGGGFKNSKQVRSRRGFHTCRVSSLASNAEHQTCGFSLSPPPIFRFGKKTDTVPKRADKAPLARAPTRPFV